MVDKPDKITSVRPVAEPEREHESAEDRAARVVSYLEAELGVPVYPACGSDGSVVFATNDGEIVGRLHKDGLVEVVRDGKVEKFDISELPECDDEETFEDVVPLNDQYLSGPKSADNPLATDPSTQQNQSAKQFAETPAVICEYPAIPLEHDEKTDEGGDARKSRAAGAGSEETPLGLVSADKVPGAPGSGNPPSVEVSGVIFPSHSKDSPVSETTTPGSANPAPQPNTNSSSGEGVGTGAAPSEGSNISASATDPRPAVESTADTDGVSVGKDLHGNAGSAVDSGTSTTRNGSISSVERVASLSSASAVTFVSNSSKSAQHGDSVSTGDRAGGRRDPFAASRSVVRSPLPYAGRIHMNMGHGYEGDTTYAISQTNARAGLLTFNFASPPQHSGAPSVQDRHHVRVERPLDSQHTRDQGDQGKDGRERDDSSRNDEEQPELPA